jgi:hypothetical protein
VTEYDVYVVRAADRSTEGDLDRAPSGKTGWLALRTDLAAARETVRAILEAGGQAYVAPSEYRIPRLTIDEARELAERRRCELIDAGRTLEPFGVEFDDIVWWTFVADDTDAIARDHYPGRIDIAVDKLSGQIRTEDEFQQWLALSALPQMTDPSTDASPRDEEREGER